MICVFCNKKIFSGFTKSILGGAPYTKCGTIRGNLILSRTVPVPKGQNRRLPLAPKPPPHPTQKGRGACPPPPGGLQPRHTPGFFSGTGVTGGANRSRVCTKRAEPWGCPGPQQNKAFKEQKRCAPLFRPVRLKYRSKAIKTGKPQKTPPVFLFFILCTKSRFCPKQNRAVITAKAV